MSHEKLLSSYFANDPVDHVLSTAIDYMQHFLDPLLFRNSFWDRRQLGDAGDSGDGVLMLTEKGLPIFILFYFYFYSSNF